MVRDHIHFVTGRLAAEPLGRLLEGLAPQAGFDYSIDVLAISVAALMTPAWIARRIQVPDAATRVLVPGYCHGDLEGLARQCGRPVARGPKDLRRLPQFFGSEQGQPAALGQYDIAILAEINHAPRLGLAAILDLAGQLRGQGADVIDLGCEPGEVWSGVGEAVRALRDVGHRVSIDSHEVKEIAAAVGAGAELVLSVDRRNRAAAPDWGCEVVAVPDVPGDLDGLAATVAALEAGGVRYRLDPILEPIGYGFAASLGRYLEVRRRWPQAEMLMGIGNLTELTEVDTAAVNVLLLGFCQELGIRSVLTTQVVSWAQTTVRECDLGRRLVHHAISTPALPKHVDSRLLVARDPDVPQIGDEELARLAGQLKDPNYRLYASGGRLHALAAGWQATSDDPYELFAAIAAHGGQRLDAAHAFYLGYELAKAATALTLGKEYRQDEALDWGYLTRPEPTLHQRRLDRSTKRES